MIREISLIILSEPGFMGFKDYPDISSVITSCKSINPENHGSDNPGSDKKKPPDKSESFTLFAFGFKLISY